MEHSLTWNYLIAIYLFMAGLSSGAAVLASIGEIINNMDERIKRISAYLAPFPVLLGLFCLVLDLHRPWNFYQVLIHYHVTSVLSWGAFFLLVFPVIAFAYAAIVYWNISGILRRTVVWLNLILGIAIGIYAGLLLSAIYSNPVWSNPVIAFLFFISALSTGLCMVLMGGQIWDGLEKSLVRKIIPEKYLPPQKRLNFDHQASARLIKIDAVIIVMELLVISTLIISYALRPTGGIALGVLAGGGYYLTFWIGVVLIGLIIPLILGVFELRSETSSNYSKLIGWTEPVLVLAGGFILRYVIVYAGQIIYPILTFYR